jgi:hypothetical protein
MIYCSNSRSDILEILIAMSRLSTKCDIFVAAATYRRAKELADALRDQPNYGQAQIFAGVDRTTVHYNENKFTFIHLNDGSRICGTRNPMLLWTDGIPLDVIEAVVAGRMAVASSPVEAVRRDAIHKLSGGGI